MKKISLFFGAGAECSYGLPSGGKFALDIFKMSTVKDKETFKAQLSSIDSTSRYAKWLPDDFMSKKLTAFTKGQYDSIVKGSLENKRNLILDYLKNFDNNVSYIVERLENENINIDKVLEDTLGVSIGEITYGKEIKLNKLFHRLNDGIFEKSPDSIDLFDDLGAIFTLDYKNTGMKGLELLIDSDELDSKNISTNEEIINYFGILILEDIYSKALDYQTLIDSNWRYIYHPKTDWGRFSKIIIFLHTVKRYISGMADENRTKIDKGNGYYHDVLKLKELYSINSIGTTNYNSFIEEVTDEKVHYLNGSVNDYYDPYLNKIVSLEDNKDKKHVIVPFLFTQSGIKPLTSVKMSERYVDLFHKFKESDIICISGFGFNADDGHINGMFRELIEDYKKEIVILHYNDGRAYKEKQVKGYYQERLRLDNSNRINIIPVDRNRKNINSNNMWYETLE